MDHRMLARGKDAEKIRGVRFGKNDFLPLPNRPQGDNTVPKLSGFFKFPILRRFPHLVLQTLQNCALAVGQEGLDLPEAFAISAETRFSDTNTGAAAQVVLETRPVPGFFVTAKGEQAF